jgi:hypothetical protein
MPSGQYGESGNGRSWSTRSGSRYKSTAVSPIGEQSGDQFLGNLLVASDGHAAMISRPPPRHHWFTDRMTSERTHIRVVAALAGLFFVVAVVLMASAPWVLLQPDQQTRTELNRWFLTVAGCVDAIAAGVLLALSHCNRAGHCCSSNTPWRPSWPARSFPSSPPSLPSSQSG